MNKVRVYLRWFKICIFLAVAAYVGPIIWAKLDWGSSPNRSVFANVVNDHQRATEQFCTGITVTPESTWLISKIDERWADEVFNSQVKNLAKQVYDADNYRKRSYNRYSWNSFSYVSRLDEQGIFQPVAMVPKALCLRTTPDGKRVFLMTGLSRPTFDIDQSIIFESADQGQTWSWLKEGLFPDSSSDSWDINPYFYDEKSVWDWSKYKESERTFSKKVSPSGRVSYKQNKRKRTYSLQHSSDGGITVNDVVTSDNFLHSSNSLRQQLHISEENWRNHENKNFIVQLSDKDAVLWVSQRYSYTEGNDKHIVNVTSRARLSLKNGSWLMGEVQYIEGLYLDDVFHSSGDPIVALMSFGDYGRQKFALLDSNTLEWKTRGNLPNVFAWLPYTSYFINSAHVGKNAIVVDIQERHSVPYWLYPWGDDTASISAGGLFYSTDRGYSWSRLSVGDDFLGFDVKTDRAFGTNVYSNNKAINAYQLYQE